ncbi:hypothetical protein Pve01_75810 [Planomonospora venezuelensis]|nr:hypothetical protein Pve01_75810 [Planomonospora venezuelensis]
MERPEAVVPLPPLVRYRDQVALVCGWRQASDRSWWAQPTWLPEEEQDAVRPPYLRQRQVAGGQVDPVAGQDYRRVPRLRSGSVLTNSS